MSEFEILEHNSLNYINNGMCMIVSYINFHCPAGG